MAYGFQITNDFGTTSIDDTYKNYSMTSKGTKTFSGGTQFGSIAFSGNNPVIAVAPPAIDYCAVCIPAITQTGPGAFSAELNVSGGVTSVDYYIFDYVPNTTPTGLVRVFDGAGNPTFDSNLPYLRGVEFCIGTSRSSSYVSGTKEAAVICTPNLSQDGGPGYYIIYASGVQRQSGGLLYPFNMMTEYHDTSDNGNNNDVNPTYSYDTATLIIDVTGL